MKDYKELFVGQIFKAEDEPTIKVLEIDKGLQDKYPDLCFCDAQHGLNEGIDVRYSMDGEESIDDYIQFIDYTYTNCYEPNKTSPNGTGNMEPVYKREEEDEKIEAVAEPGWDADYMKSFDERSWPYTNVEGNCLCGHEALGHLSRFIEDNQSCAECNCSNFSLDKWAAKGK